MGWTHYWERQVELPSEDFKRALADCNKVIWLLDISLAGADGNGPPVFTDEEVVFNGVEGTNCEPFVFRHIQHPRPERNVVFEYCKTEHLPYDLAVQCCLVVFHHYFEGLIEISTDGSDDDWQEAFDICRKELGFRKIEFKQK